MEGVTVVCRLDLNELSAKLKTEIEREAETKPVIVFGKNND